LPDELLLIPRPRLGLTVRPSLAWRGDEESRTRVPTEGEHVAGLKRVGRARIEAGHNDGELLAKMTVTIGGKTYADSYALSEAAWDDSGHLELLWDHNQSI